MQIMQVCAFASHVEKSSVIPAGLNPFSPKAYAIRYWTRQISNGLPKFLIDKASPLTALESATFRKLAIENVISTQLPSFCSSANILCFPDSSSSLKKHKESVNFATYLDKNFTNYGSKAQAGDDTFTSYSEGLNNIVDSFQGYSHESDNNNEKFNTYATDANIADQSFNTYGTGSNGGAGEFKNYQKNVNKEILEFTSYSANANNREQRFTTYADMGNAGTEGFQNYARDGNGASNDFTAYGKDSNVIASTFSSYGQNANGQSDTFTFYSNNASNPQNNLKNYGSNGNAAAETFNNYRDGANVGDDTFQSYSKSGNGEKVNFVNYGKTMNEGSDKFKSYGTDGSNGQQVGFKVYSDKITFNEYAKNGVTFKQYTNQTSSSAELSTMAMSGKPVHRWVEPGKFFRDEMLKAGVVIHMPDIRDKMPKRSFLPRVISSILPFSTLRISEMKKIFLAGDNSTMAGMLIETLTECERAPAREETKRCVSSVEDMIDFAISVLGGNVVVRTTENTEGSKQNVMIGEVKGINGGKVTKAVSCHQSLFPYLIYYCHSVPKVRVYEADLLDPKSKTMINHGVAICHVDTSAWSASHGAFVALGSGPGKIEVCHWIFENDMNWAMAD
ncbi:hypothetical protein LguiB_024797 [Lonicera macranthoides]